MANSAQKLSQALGKLEAEYKERFFEPLTEEVIVESLRERLETLKREFVNTTLQGLDAPDVLFLLSKFTEKKPA